MYAAFVTCDRIWGDKLEPAGTPNGGARVEAKRQQHKPTNRAAGPTSTSGSSTCSALSLAAGAVSFHARHTVAANLCGHIKEVISTAEIGHHTRQVRKDTNVCTITRHVFSDLDGIASGTVTWLVKL